VDDDGEADKPTCCAELLLTLPTLVVALDGDVPLMPINAASSSNVADEEEEEEEEAEEAAEAGEDATFGPLTPPPDAPGVGDNGDAYEVGVR